MKQMYSREEVIKLIEENSCKRYDATLLVTWEDDSPGEYKTSVVLNNISKNEIIKALEGVCIGDISNEDAMMINPSNGAYWSIINNQGGTLNALDIVLKYNNEIVLEEKLF